MSEAPQLSEEDIRDEVQTLHLRPHRSRSTALRGKGENGELKIRVESHKPDEDPVVLFQVRSVGCELSLRQALWSDPETPKILLVDGVQSLPHDLVGRLAGGEIREVTEARRLARLFGATAVSPLLATSLVGRALLEPPTIRPSEIQGSTVDLETGLRALLWARAALPQEGALSEERLLAFFATHPLPAPFARQLGLVPGASEAQQKAGGELRAAIAQHFVERHGQSARLAFEAWCGGQGERAAALIFVLEAAAPRLLAHSYLRARLVGWIQGLDTRQAPDQTLTRLAAHSDSLKSLATRLHLRLDQENALLSVLAEADRLLPDAESREGLDESLFLPDSFDRGLGKLGQSLGAALEASAPTSSLAAVQRCEQALEQLSRHVLAGKPPRSERLDRSRMAARLVAWLASGEPEGRSPNSLGEALAVEGGLVDRALLGAAGLSEGPLREVVERVRETARRRRESLARSFSQGLSASLDPAETGVVGPESVIDQVVIPFLSGKPSRRLLLLLVPGLRWAAAHELLETLERTAQPPQGMLAFRDPTTPPGGLLPLPPLFGNAGSMTEIRSRLLAGRPAAPGQILDEARDEARFRAHEGLRAVAGAEEPAYLPAPEAILEDGGQKAIVQTRIASSRRLVAVGLPVPGERVASGLLLDLLRQASEAGRATLLVSCGGGTEEAEPAVLPLLLLGSAWLETLGEEPDKEMQLQAPPRLPFWQLEVPPRAPKTASRPPARASKPRAANPNQMALLEVPLPTPPLRPQLEKLFASSGPVPKQVLDVLEAIYNAGGTMSEEDLARKMNMFGPRIGGLVARASEMVSQDGLELLSYDHHARMARLNKPLLKQLLEGMT